MSPILYIGNGSIGLAIGLSLFGIIAFYVASKSESASSFGRAAVYGTFILMTVANLAMIWALLHDDFAVSYVAHVGSRETPRWISAISLWSSLEGSILFWGWILSGYSAVCIYYYREKPQPFFSWVGLVLLAVQLFFYLLLALPANPFLPIDPIPANGPGPNPLLQNHWLMAIHPPCLYMGYIGFTIPFAFAIAALMEREGISWISLVRRWTLFAWSFQSMAIVLGGWWSYAVLGWGGYWAWDPVENASFMPWLTATALVHSIIVQEKRKMLPLWNLSLTILTFLLTLLGTFLTRSGVLDSVHSFTESHVGPWFLVFIGIVLTASVALLLWKGPKMSQRSAPEKFESFWSLEVLFLFNNLLFLSFAFIVFLGTIYPLVVEAIQGKRISIGEPYFNQMTIPIVGTILLLMGIGMATPWRKGNFKNFLRLSKGPFLFSLLVTIGSFFAGAQKPWVVAIILLSSFAFFLMLSEALRRSPRRVGMWVAHTGALILIVAVALSSSYEKTEEVTLKKGESVTVGDTTLTLEGITAEETPQRFEVKTTIGLLKKGKNLDPLIPQMNFYPVSREPIGSPAIRSTWSHDLYLTLIHFEKDGSEASLRVMVAPAVVWIWIGGGIVMLGGLLALVLKKKEGP